MYKDIKKKGEKVKVMVKFIRKKAFNFVFVIDWLEWEMPLNIMKDKTTFDLYKDDNSLLYTKTSVTAWVNLQKA